MIPSTILGDTNVSKEYAAAIFSVRVRVVSRFQEGTKDAAFPSETAAINLHFYRCNNSALTTVAERSKA
jgi:hypothetical protein